MPPPLSRDPGVPGKGPYRIEESNPTVFRQKVNLRCTDGPCRVCRTDGLSPIPPFETHEQMGLYHVTVDKLGNTVPVRVDKSELRGRGSTSLFINGQDTPLNYAAEKGRQQILDGGIGDFYMFYDPTHEGPADTVESIIGKFYSGTSASRELADVLVQASGSRLQCWLIRTDRGIQRQYVPRLWRACPRAVMPVAPDVSSAAGADAVVAAGAGRRPTATVVVVSTRTGERKRSLLSRARA